LSRSNLAEAVYTQLKNDLFEFRLLPGDRFTESEVAARVGVSRTPVREALYKLQQEGHIEVSTRNGWNVKPLDFARYDHLYDVRVVLELAAARKVCGLDHDHAQLPVLAELQKIWLVPVAQRLDNWVLVGKLDEQFHESLVAAAGNPEMSRIFHDITERIRIIRRLDFTKPERIQHTYDEHGEILRSLLARRADQVAVLLKAHIEASKAEVKKITLHKLHTARTG
jgi:DNA-binding GntR family transcriptional regulator